VSTGLHLLFSVFSVSMSGKHQRSSDSNTPDTSKRTRKMSDFSFEDAEGLEEYPTFNIDAEKEKLPTRLNSRGEPAKIAVFEI
jgi:hypothetical protein